MNQNSLNNITNGKQAGLIRTGIPRKYESNAGVYS